MFDDGTMTAVFAIAFDMLLTIDYSSSNEYSTGN